VAKFVKGDVVVIPFPFSDLTQAKRRPALVVSVLKGDDLILCQVTSQFVKDSYAISIEGKDFEEGGLKQKQKSNVRPIGYLQQIVILSYIESGILKKTN
jgi:mRNA interferase MazF